MSLCRVFERVSARCVLALLTCLGCANLFALRVNLSVAMVAMVRHIDSINTSLSNDECDQRQRNTSAHVGQTGHFDWDEQLQGHVLAAFFYGYSVTQILGGWLADRCGGRRVLGTSVFITSLLTLLTPAAASLHVYVLIAVRVLEGLFQGLAFPSIHSLWSKWAPVKERSRLVAFTYAGAQLGTVVAMPVTGILCEQGFAGGWPSAFYLFGSFGMAWTVLWGLLAFDSPDLHPRISTREKEYILQSTGHKHQRPYKVPLKAILTSPPVWAIIAAHFAYDWGAFTMLTMLPQFMKHVLRFDIQQNGLLSALPYLVLWLANTISGPMADRLRGRLVSTKATRKIMNSIGLFIPACLMVGVGSVGCDPVLAVTLLTLGVGTSGFTMSGFSVNHIDIAPGFAGILMGIANTVGTTSGFIGPQVAGALTNNDPSMSRWRIFFFVTAAIYAFGGLTFLVFSDGREQKWSVVSGLTTKSLTNGFTSIYLDPKVNGHAKKKHDRCERSTLLAIAEREAFGNEGCAHDRARDTAPNICSIPNCIVVSGNGFLICKVHDCSDVTGSTGCKSCSKSTTISDSTS